MAGSGWVRSVGWLRAGDAEEVAVATGLAATLFSLSFVPPGILLGAGVGEWGDRYFTD